MVGEWGIIAGRRLRIVPQRQWWCEVGRQVTATWRASAATHLEKLLVQTAICMSFVCGSGLLLNILIIHHRTYCHRPIHDLVLQIPKPDIYWRASGNQRVWRKGDEDLEIVASVAGPVLLARKNSWSILPMMSGGMGVLSAVTMFLWRRWMGFKGGGSCTF